MKDVITPRVITEEMLAISRQLDDAHASLVEHAQAAVEKDRDYRKAKAEAWLKAVSREEKRLAKHVEDDVNAVMADLRYDAKLAGELHAASLEWVRTLRQKLSALQSIANAVRSEAELAGRFD